MPQEKVLAKGLIEKIGLEESILNYQADHLQDKIKTRKEIKDHRAGIKEVLEVLIDKEKGVIKSVDEIEAVGHRVVHGGEKFQSSILITDEVIKTIEEISDLAPLHNPPNLLGIRASFEVLGDKPNVAVFDTAFHQTMPKKAYIYGLPFEFYSEKRIRRYGFHGTSHHYVAKQAADFMKKDLSELKLITCHLGNGSSICAVDKGKSVDTSLGYGTMSGVIMGTRAGDLDPAIILEMMEKYNMSADEIKKVIYKKSGVMGISGVSSDMREIQDARDEGNERASIAVDLLAYSIVKYIGAYTAVMNGVDGLVFTAGIGENDHIVREEVCKYLDYLGVEFDIRKNETSRANKAMLTKPNSKVKVMLIPTNEEIMIAQDTMSIVKKD
jgi:acetate kinase